VATDIAARGIDVSGISHVINFDMPATPETTPIVPGVQDAPVVPALPSPLQHQMITK
jgi:hypothetical protein